MVKNKLLKKIILTALMLVATVVILVTPSFALQPVANSSYNPVYCGNVACFAVNQSTNARLGFPIPLCYYFNGTTVSSTSNPRSYVTEDGSTYTAYTFNRVSISNSRGSFYGVEGAPAGGSGYYGLEIISPRVLINDGGAYKIYEGDIAYFLTADGQAINVQVVVRGVKDIEYTQKAYSVSKSFPTSSVYLFQAGRICANYVLDDILSNMLVDFDTINDIQILPTTRIWSRVGVIQSNSLSSDYKWGQGYSSYVNVNWDFEKSLADGVSNFLSIELFPDFKLSYLLTVVFASAIVFVIIKLVK